MSSRDAATPADVLAALVASDATRPRLTWYDDAPGPTQGERIELSGRVLVNWAAKAANLLADDLDVQRGDVVALDLPPHWRAVCWAFAAWRLGAVVSVEDDVPAAALVTDASEPRSAPAQVVSISLPALARSWAASHAADVPLPRGAVDEAAELANHADVFEPFDEPGPGDDALASQQGRWTAADVVVRARARAAAAGWQHGERVAVLCPVGSPGTAELAEVLVTLLAVWSRDGSAVLVRGAAPGAADVTSGRLAAERVTSACGPAGTPAARR